MSGGWSAVIHSGVNHSIYGNGGAECTAYISLRQRCLESLIVVPVCVFLCYWAFERMPWPAPVPRAALNPTIRRTLLTIYCTAFGIELGYKMSSRTLIYMLNPCHVLSAFQIYLLMVDTTEHWGWSMSFRLHVYSVAGGSLAMAFPVLNTRVMQWQRIVYWTQHGMVVFSPFYLYSIGGSFQMEPLNDHYTTVFSYSALLLYHYLPLQIFGFYTGINLNNMLCPAVSDPFKGRYWRMLAVVHQAIWVALHGKVYIWLLNVLRPYLLVMIGPVPQNLLKTTQNTQPHFTIVASKDTLNQGSCPFPQTQCSKQSSPVKAKKTFSIPLNNNAMPTSKAVKAD